MVNKYLKEFFRPTIKKLVPIIIPAIILLIIFIPLTKVSLIVSQAFAFFVILLAVIWVFYFYSLSCLVSHVIKNVKKQK